MLDLDQPRSVQELVLTALRLYGRYPLQFVLLAACVVVPYEVLIQVFTDATPLGGGHVSARTVLILDLVSFALIGPMVSAVQVQALFAVGNDEHLRANILLERALRVLPTVIAAEIIAGVGIALGIALFIVPGIYLALRWAVVAQVAAAEPVDWPGAIRRSGDLVRGNYPRVIGVVAIVVLIGLAVAEIGSSVAGDSTRLGPVIAEIAVLVLVQSFSSLVTAMLYFDLYAREGAAYPQPPS